MILAEQRRAIAPSRELLTAFAYSHLDWRSDVPVVRSSRSVVLCLLRDEALRHPQCPRRGMTPLIMNPEKSHQLVGHRLKAKVGICTELIRNVGRPTPNVKAPSSNVRTHEKPIA
jgi:hypothetical protein